MNKYKVITTLFYSLFFLAAVHYFPLTAQEESAQQIDTNAPGAVYFTPPEGWMQGKTEDLSPSVKLIVIGKGKGAFPPSIHLAVEPFKGSLKDYLKLIKSITAAKGVEWQDLGKIQTEAGEGSLSQIDSQMQWGQVRMMHAIVAKNGVVYILTASALREEFPSYYKQFFDAMRSLHVND